MTSTMIIMVPYMSSYSGGTSGPVPVSAIIALALIVLSWGTSIALMIIAVTRGLFNPKMDRAVSISLGVSLAVTILVAMYGAGAASGVLP